MGATSLYYLEDLKELKKWIDSTIRYYKKNALSNEDIDVINEKTSNDYFDFWNNTKFERKPKEAGFLYLFHDTQNNRLKIGRSRKPKHRIRQLQWSACTKFSSLYELPNMGNLEQEIIKRFNNYNISGEWFSYQQEIVDYFATLKSNQENGIWKTLV